MSDLLRDLKFKYLSAQNFLCFGPDGIEIDLTTLGNLILVHGTNHDVKINPFDGSDDDQKWASSNGSGKSSIPEIIIYTLFGKLVKQPKKLTHKDAINNQIGKNLRTEIRWDNYRVVRTRKPDGLRIWESKDGTWSDETEISLGGMPATQKLIEEKFGFNYETTVNILIFTDDNAGAFLECDLQSKREIVENLLALEKYTEFSDRAKEFKNKAKEKIKIIGAEYESLLSQCKNCEDRVVQVLAQEKTWVQNKRRELETDQNTLLSKKAVLGTSDIGKEMVRYHEAQDQIEAYNSKIPEFEENKAKLDAAIEAGGLKVDTIRQKKAAQETEISGYNTQVKNFTVEIENRKFKINKMESKKETKCGECFGVVQEENYIHFVKSMKNEITHYTDQIEKINRKIELAKKVISDDLQPVLDKINANLEIARNKSRAISQALVESRNKILELSKIKEPKVGATEMLLEEQIKSLTKQIEAKEHELAQPSPFLEIIKSAKQEVETKKKEHQDKKASMVEAEKNLSYYEFWVKAFGDSGIKRFIISEIIPALNSRIAYWLQFLIDGKINMKFNDELEELIERNPSDGDPFVYHQMSRGEKRRLNLTVSQAFGHVMMLNSGVVPSLVFLDEVTTNIDQIGVIGVYNMIMELAKDRQVFITSHDQGLLSMLQGCEVINLERKNGFSKIVSFNKSQGS